MMHKLKQHIALAATVALTPAVFGFPAYAATDTLDNLPDTMRWSSYDQGSAGYAEASAIANAFNKTYDSRIRITPSGSSIGRLEPLVRKQVNYGFLATETFFATEGIADFASREWGPQDLRILAGRPSSFGMVTAKDADIRSITDAEGKRVAYVAGNPSVNLKCDAILAFEGMTREDVEAIKFPTYANAMSSLAEGKADATCTTTTPSQMYELAESPRGIHWVDIPKDDEEGWERITEVAPFFQPYTETKGAGISEDNPAELFAYRYPMIVTRADVSADEVYAFMKALDETYGQYKDATDVMPRWDLEKSGTPPADAPFHEGAIRYLKEEGIWTDEMQEWNDAQLARLSALQDAWDEAMAEGEDMDDDEFAELWEEYRENALDELN